MQTKMMDAIIISTPLVWGVRNVINSGVYTLLQGEFDVYLAVPPEGHRSLVEIGVAEDRIIPLYTTPSNRIFSIINLLLKTAHQQFKGTDSDQIFAKWYGKEQRNASLLKDVVIPHAAKLFKNPERFAWLSNIYCKHSKRSLPKNILNQLLSIKPAAALSTSSVVNWDWPLFNVLQDAGIPTATHILSFDNLTSRGYFPMRKFDRYFTWQQAMSDELVYFFGIDPDKITITGTPQFDFHILPSCFWNRGKTSSKLGIDPDKPYIVYCANHHKHTPGELQLITLLIESLRAMDYFKNFQWVIRLHPMDQFKRWESFFVDDPNVIISRPWKREDHLAYWGTPTNDEIALLSNTLRYAAARVTVASTVALDSCVTDTPIICVGFHPDKGSAEDNYYHDVHFSHHYEPIISSGAVSFVQNVEEFIGAMYAAVDNPKGKSTDRQKLKRQICGTVDGKAAYRVAEEISRLAYQSKTGSFQ